ncbi:hypothetical protein Csa_021967 [Cucumis sativus]|uniref:Uncharacterized protein n=1 Tax=Cucumis sativus TaxID=3659 RepID=A0A0A0LM81_CUCSA|nr:hypothetical protein Csa_021967 [Cucumis sativus]
MAQKEMGSPVRNNVLALLISRPAMVDKPFYTTSSSFYNSPTKVTSNSTSSNTWYSNSQISFLYFLYSSTPSVNCCVISTLLTLSGFQSAA